jgi:hypothetical protein
MLPLPSRGEFRSFPWLVAVLKQKYEPSGALSSHLNSVAYDHFSASVVSDSAMILNDHLSRVLLIAPGTALHLRTSPAGWHHECLPQLRLGRQDRDQRLVGAFTPGLQDGPHRRVPDCGELHGAGEEELSAPLPSGDGFRVPISAGGELPGCALR